MSARKGIPLADITGSPLAKQAKGPERVKGLEALAELARLEAGTGPKKAGDSKIVISKKTGDTQIDVVLSDSKDLPATLDAIGYRRPGFFTRLYHRVI